MIGPPRPVNDNLTDRCPDSNLSVDTTVSTSCGANGLCQNRDTPLL